MSDFPQTAWIATDRPRRRGVLPRTKRRIIAFACGALIVLVLTFFLAPFLWMFVFSVYPANTLQADVLDLSLSNLTLDSYVLLLTDSSFLIPMANSAIVGISTTIICMILGSACAYAIARIRFRGRQPLLLGMMTVQAIPVIVLAVPLFRALRSVAWPYYHLHGVYSAVGGLDARWIF